MEAFHLALNEILTWKSGNPNDSKYMASAILTCLHFLCLTVKKFQVWWFLMRVFTLLCISSLRDQSKEHVVQDGYKATLTFHTKFINFTM